MREIKFRAWDKISKWWVGFNWACAVDNHGVLYPAETTPKTDVVIMQYTGLKDKNGKEIYEGDIVKSPSNEIGVVKYGEAEFVAMAGDEIDGCWNLISIPEHSKIIGNIYENPDLLKELYNPFKKNA